MSVQNLKLLLLYILSVSLLSGKTRLTPPDLKEEDGTYRVYAVFVDHFGVKWFGTNRGLLRYNGVQWHYFTEQDVLAGNRINALVADDRFPDPVMWVATDSGISRLFFDENGIVSSESYTTLDGLADNRVEDIAFDSNGRSFLGSAGRITVMTDQVVDTLTYARYPGSMYSTQVRDLFVYGDTLYIAQDGGIGRFVSGVDGVTGASRWGDEPSYGVSPYTRDIRSILVKGAVIQLFGSGVGVEVHRGYQPKQNWELWTTDQGLVHNEVITIKEDLSGGWWFGTNGGVSQLTGDTWMNYTSADGLLNDTVFDIGFDTDGSVWFGTASGACRLKDGVFQDFFTAIPDPEVSTPDLGVSFYPAADILRIRYTLKRQGGPVEGRLFDSGGRMVAAWNDLPSFPGENQVDLPVGSSLINVKKPGFYVFCLIADDGPLVRKVILQ